MASAYSKVQGQERSSLTINSNSLHIYDGATVKIIGPRIQRLSPENSWQPPRNQVMEPRLKHSFLSSTGEKCGECQSFQLFFEIRLLSAWFDIYKLEEKLTSHTHIQPRELSLPLGIPSQTWCFHRFPMSFKWCSKQTLINNNWRKPPPSHSLTRLKVTRSLGPELGLSWVSFWYIHLKKHIDCW